MTNGWPGGDNAIEGASVGRYGWEPTGHIGRRVDGAGGLGTGPTLRAGMDGSVSAADAATAQAVLDQIIEDGVEGGLSVREGDDDQGGLAAPGAW